MNSREQELQERFVHYRDMAEKLEKRRMNRHDMGLVVRFEGGPWDGQRRQMETATHRIDVPILADDLTVEPSETDTEPPRIIQGYYILVSTATEASHGLCRYGWFSDPRLQDQRMN